MAYADKSDIELSVRR